MSIGLRERIESQFGMTAEELIERPDPVQQDYEARLSLGEADAVSHKRRGEFFAANLRCNLLDAAIEDFGECRRWPETNSTAHVRKSSSRKKCCATYQDRHRETVEFLREMIGVSEDEIVKLDGACPKNWDFPTSAILSRILTAISTSRNL